MKAHEKWLAAVLAASTLAALIAPRWVPDAPVPTQRIVPRAADGDDAPTRTRPAPLPPFDAAAFALQVETAHYAIASNATPAQTKRVGEVLETLHAAYAGFFAHPLPERPATARFQVALYRDRADFQRHNTSRAWAEGFYRKPVCHAYYDADRANAVHWMLHEATHQLDAEWARFPRTPWVGEGLAAYLATSRLDNDGLHPGELDPDTYPTWWLGELHLSGDRQRDFMARRLVPLRELIDADAPTRPADVNAYYIGYWSLTHYLLHGDGGRHAAAFRAMVEGGGSLAEFEKRVGSVDAIEARWYAHLQAQRDGLLAARLSSQ